MVDWKYCNDFKRKHIKTLPGRKVHYNELHLPPREKAGWTEATARTTIEVCLWAWKRGLLFATEVPMIGMSRRADIVIPELFQAQIVEVVDTESVESIESKRVEYSRQGMTFLAVPADPEKAIFLLEKSL